MPDLNTKYVQEMSWFEPGAFASLAKNAIKEAQKTIDKALDIREETTSDTGM